MIVEFIKKHNDGRHDFKKGSQVRLTNEYARELIDKGVCKGLDEQSKDNFIKVENERVEQKEE